MTERLQYPIQAAIDPETLDDPLRDEIQWFQPFSEPIRQLAGVAAVAAIIASTGSAPIDAETLGDPLRDEIQWFQPLSEPVLRRPSVAEIPSFFTDPPIDDIAEEVVTLDEFQPFSVPVLPLPIQQPAAFITDPTTLDATLRDEIQWFMEFSVPVLPEHQTRPGLFIIDPATLDAAQRDEIQWWTDLSVPVQPAHPAQPGWIADDPVAPVLVDDRSFEWFQAFSYPVLPGQLHPHASFFIDPEAFGEVGVVVAGPPKHEGLRRNVGKLLR